MKILVVGCQPVVCQTIQALLTDRAKTLDSAIALNTALERLTQTRYDAIVVDVGRRRGVDGIEFCRQVRSRGETIPILAVTRRRGQDQTAIALQAGATDCIAYPFNPDEFLLRVHHLNQVAELSTLLERGRAQQAEQTQSPSDHTTALLALYDQVGCGCHFLDAEGRIVQINETELRLFGYTREEMLGRKITDFFTPEGRQTFQDNYPQLLQCGWVNDLELTIRCKDGSLLPVSISGTAVKDATGNVLISQSGVIDIRDRKQAEIALSESETRLQSITNLVPDLLWDSEPSGSTNWYNQRWMEYTGQTFEQAIGWGWTDVIHPDDRAGAVRRYQEAVEQGVLLQQEHRIRRHDGAYRWFVTKAVPLKDAGGRVIKMYGAATDIHEQRVALEALRHNHEMFSALINNAPFGIYLIDADFRLQQINNGAEAVFSNIKPLIGRDFGEILRIIWQEPFATEAISRFRHTLASGESYYSPVIVQPRANIEEIQAYDWQIHRITLPDGHYGVVCYFYDLSQIKRTEAALQESEQVLQLAMVGAQTGSWDWVLATGKLTWSPALYRLHGLDPTAPMPEYAVWYETCVHPDDRAWVNQYVAEVIAQRQPNFQLEFRILHPQCGVRWILSLGHLTVDGQGEPIRLSGISLDISDRKRREANLAFLADITETWSQLSSAAEIIQAVGAKVGSYLQVVACNFCEIDEIGDQVIYFGRWQLPGEPILPDRICLSEQVSQDFCRRARAGETIVSQNTQTNPVTQAEGNASIGALSFITVPFHKNGEWKYLFSIHDHVPRTWRDDEIDLVQEVGNRLVPFLDRARAEAALRDNQAMLHLALSSARAGTWTLDLTSRQFTVSSETLDLYGLDPTSPPLSYDDWYKHLLHPDDRDRVDAYYQQVIVQCQSPIQLEFRVLHPQLGTRWIQIIGEMLCNPQGEPVQVSGINLDISDRKEAELALQASETKFRLFAENSHAVIWIANPISLEALYVNAAYETVWGRSRQSLMDNPMSWLESIHPDDLDHAQHQLLEQRQHQSSQVEYRIIRPDGSIRWIWDWGFALRHPDGVVYFYGGIAEDVTDRKLAEQKVREQAALLDITSDAIFVRDLDNRILYWNPGAERLYGWSAAEAIDQLADQLFQTPTSPITVILQRLLDTGEWRGEVSKITKSGQTVTVAARWTLMRDAAGEPKAILTVDTDITEKKLLEAQFYHSQRLESLGILASGIAHDLNNIFTPILTASQLLQTTLESQISPEAMRMLQLLERTTKRGASLIQQILTFARGNDGDRVTVAVQPILHEVVTVLQSSLPPSIRMTLSIPDSFPWLISANPIHIHQILMNLCINARDAMADSGILALSLDHYWIDQTNLSTLAPIHFIAHPGEYIRITIADTGTGIPPEVRDRIFDPFFTTKPQGKGSGLGLSIVFGIVKNYGGFIHIMSELGQGSSFQIYLPVITTEQTGGQTSSRLPKQLTDGQHQMVLLVDDDEVLQITLQAFLEHYHYTVISTNDSIQSIALYREHQAAIVAVILDIMMPNISGLELIPQLKQLTPDLTIIAMSGLPTHREAAIAAGATTFLSKPFTPDTILQTLHHSQSIRV